MSRRRTRSSLSVILLVVSLVMIGYGGYMSMVDITYKETGDIWIEPDVPDVPDIITTVETKPTIVYYPVRPLPDLEIQYANLFGGDGTINLANIILFLGIGLFVISFLMGRR